METDIKSHRLDLVEPVFVADEIFRDVADCSTDVFYIMSPALSQLVYISPAYENIWGRSRESAYSSPRAWIDAVHPEDRMAVECEVRRVLEDGENAHEYRIVRPDGSVRWIYGRSYTVRRASKFRGYVVGVARDVTEQKLAGALAGRQVVQSTALVAFSNKVLADADDSDGLWRDALSIFMPAIQAEAGELLEWSAGEQVRHVRAGLPEGYEQGPGKALVDFSRSCQEPLICHDILTDSRPFWPAWLHKLGIRSVLVTTLSDRDRQASASMCFYSKQVGCFDAPNARFAMMAGSILTAAWESQRNRWALRESEHMLRQLTESIDEVFYVADVAMERIYYVSPAYEAVWGRTRASLYANPHSWIDSIHPDDQAVVAKAIGKMPGGADFDQTFRILRPNGQVRWVRDRAFVIRDEKGFASRMAGVATDLTVQREAEANSLRLARAEARLEARDETLSMVAHDLRNPLAALQIQLQLLQDESSEDKRQEQLRSMLNTTERMSGLLEELLDCSRHEKSQQALALEPTDISVVIHDACRAFPVEYEQRRLVVDCRPSEPLMIMADRRSLLRVIVNLIDNAIKYTSAAGRITVRAQWQEGVVICVADEGAGIAPEHLPHVFDRFWQPPSGRKSRLGLGLGLYIVKTIVEAHRGRVYIESSLGAGTRVYVELPKDPQNSEPPAQTEA